MGPRVSLDTLDTKNLLPPMDCPACGLVIAATLPWLPILKPSEHIALSLNARMTGNDNAHFVL